jgi:phage/plasmid-associated DNA primase
MNRGKMGAKVENCLMLYGNGSNGKGVIFDTVMGLFGRHNVSTMSLMQMIKGGDDRLRNMAAIDGKVVNFCPEIQAKDMSGYEDAFKSLCSGEPQMGRFIGRNVHTIVNVPWLIFSMNNIPKASDCSHGFFRRHLYVVFNYVVPDSMQNKHLAQDLMKEYSGILNWIYRGAKYLKARKYTFPKSELSEKQKLVVMAQNDLVASWANARGIRSSAHAKGELFCWIKSGDLYNDLQKYAELNGFEFDVTKKGMSSSLEKIGFGASSRKRAADSTKYMVYGCSEDELKTPPPVINDYALKMEDVFDKDVEYDEDDL